MITKRQIELLMKLSEKDDGYQTADELADYFHVSLRTIYQDISYLKTELDNHYATIKAISSKGYCLQIINKEKFQIYMNNLFNNYYQKFHFDDPLSRNHYIIMRLFTTKKSFLTQTQLQNELYISKSALSADLKNVKQLLKEYHLELFYNSHSGLQIRGSELNKRILILKENIQFQSMNQITQQNFNKEITIIVEEVLNSHRYIVSDVIFQSLIIHVELSVQRMIQGSFVNDEEIEEIKEDGTEYLIALDILTRLSKKFGFPLKKSEIYLLSINLLGKKNYDEDDVISQELNDFILEELIKINHEYNLDFTCDLNFRIALALHIAPMLKGMQYHMQLTNSITLNVKQNYPLAYDIAASIMMGIYESYGYKALDDETAYLAIHINLCMEQDKKMAEPKRVLLICPNRKSETLLLTQQIYRRFRQQIQDLSITPSYRFSDINLTDYDVIFTTEEQVVNDTIQAIHINYFLDEKDYLRIELALNGINDVSQLKNYFDDELMYFGNAEDKTEIIQLLCLKAERKYALKNLNEQVMRREEIGGTYYGNFVAIPHPEQMISNDTFIALAILKKPIVWQDNHNVRMILLVCIEKNNARALQLWYYLSNLISDENLVKKMIKARNSNEFRIVLDELQKMQ